MGTHSYNLDKFFIPLHHSISSDSYLIKDSFSFIQYLFSLNLNSNNLIMASFDINSLFTNIPIDEIINIILDGLFSTRQLFQGFSPEQFKDLCNFSVKNCHFMFNSKFFDQIEGVAMGSPLGPLFANIFLPLRTEVVG